MAEPTAGLLLGPPTINFIKLPPVDYTATYTTGTRLIESNLDGSNQLPPATPISWRYAGSGVWTPDA